MATRQSEGVSGTKRPSHGILFQYPRKAPRFFHRPTEDSAAVRLAEVASIEGWLGLGKIVHDLRKARDRVPEPGKAVG